VRSRLATACLAVALAPGYAVAAPDEDALGKADGYPHARLTNDFSMFNDRYKVGNFTSLEKIFWPRTIAASGSPRPLATAPEELRVSYPYAGRTYSVEDLLARQRITGLLVMKGDTILLERYQYGRTAQDKFASFSMAKTVTGILAGIALHDGLIASLDEPAQKYAPGLEGTAFGPASIRTLLRMSSGAQWSDEPTPGQPSDIGNLSGDTFFRRGAGGATALRSVRARAAPVDTRFNYSSAETFALGLAVRGAVGKDLADYASEKLWKPMGAASDASWLTDSSGMESAYCCINATLRDYGRLGLLLADDGEIGGRQVIPKDYLLAGTDPERQPEHLKPRRATSFFGYGYQAWIYPFRTRTFAARGLFGQQIIVQPSARAVIVILSAAKTGDTPTDVFVERNYFVGAVLKALGGKADVYP
jgi:CubicO group peptidase (beta-lactamase class C family)